MEVRALLRWRIPASKVVSSSERRDKTCHHEIYYQAKLGTRYTLQSTRTINIPPQVKGVEHSLYSKKGVERDPTDG